MTRGGNSYLSTDPTLGRSVAAVVASLCLLPALAVNIAWVDGAGSPWNIAAAGMIVGSALFIAAASRAATRTAGLPFLCAACLLILVNTTTAFVNASHRTSDNRDARAAQIATVARLQEQRSQWSQERQAAVQIAGHTPATALGAAVERLVATNARRWALTNHCDPGGVTVAASMTFCGQVATLRGLRDAANKRDELTARIEQLDGRLRALDTPGHADNFVAAVSDLAAFAGVRLSTHTRDAIPAIFNALRALALELLAALGPAALLVLLVPGARQVDTTRPTNPVDSDATEETPTTTTDFGAFLAACVERHPYATVRAGDAWHAWIAWCAAHNTAPGSQKRFGQAMARRFQRDRNSGRPIYRNARIRTNALPMEATHARRRVVRA